MERLWTKLLLWAGIAAAVVSIGRISMSPNDRSFLVHAWGFLSDFDRDSRVWSLRDRLGVAFSDRSAIRFPPGSLGALAADLPHREDALSRRPHDLQLAWHLGRALLDDGDVPEARLLLQRYFAESDDVPRERIGFVLSRSDLPLEEIAPRDPAKLIAWYRAGASRSRLEAVTIAALADATGNAARLKPPLLRTMLELEPSDPARRAIDAALGGSEPYHASRATMTAQRAVVGAATHSISLSGWGGTRSLPCDGDAAVGVYLPKARPNEELRGLIELRLPTRRGIAPELYGSTDNVEWRRIDSSPVERTARAGWAWNVAAVPPYLKAVFPAGSYECPTRPLRSLVRVYASKE